MRAHPAANPRWALISPDYTELAVEAAQRLKASMKPTQPKEPVAEAPSASKNIQRGKASIRPAVIAVEAQHRLWKPPDICTCSHPSLDPTPRPVDVDLAEHALELMQRGAGEKGGSSCAAASSSKLLPRFARHLASGCSLRSPLRLRLLASLAGSPARSAHRLTRLACSSFLHGRQITLAHAGSRNPGGGASRTELVPLSFY